MSPSDLLSGYPASQSVRLVQFESASVQPGIIPNTFFLTVHGTKRCSNMRVELIPLIYTKCPEWWGIEVVGCLPSGTCLPATAPFSVTIPLAGITGSKGVEILGANKKQQEKVAGGCS